jgi:hypothetical protein
LYNKHYEAFRVLAKDYIETVRYPDRRALLSVDAADAQGKLNGMTIVELLTIANLTQNTGERVYMQADGKTITMFAEKIAPQPPLELRQ